MSDKLTVNTQVKKVTQDMNTGWFTAETEHGKYATKIEEIAKSAHRLVGEQVTITYTENTKTTAEGKTYVNKYLDSVTPVAPTQSGEIERVGGGGGMSPEAALRVTRLSAVSSASTLLAGTELSVRDLFHLTELIVNYAYRGKEAVVSRSEPAEQGFGNLDPGSELPPPTDDIPF